MKRKGYNVTYRGKKENLDKKCIVVKKTDNFCLKHPFDGTGLKNCEYRAPCARPKLEQGAVHPFISLEKYVIFILTKPTNVLFVLKLTIPLYFLSSLSVPDVFARLLTPLANLMKRNFPRWRRGGRETLLLSPVSFFCG